MCALASAVVAGAAGVLAFALASSTPHPWMACAPALCAAWMAADLAIIATASRAPHVRAVSSAITAIVVLSMVHMVSEASLDIPLLVLASAGAVLLGVLCMMRYGEECAVEELPATSWIRASWLRMAAAPRDLLRAL
jgi:hypothetical protein